MGTVVVGYVPKPEGEAALNSGIAEAKLRGAKLVVVNSHRGGSEFDEDAAVKAEQEMSGSARCSTSSGVEHELRQLVRGFEPAEDLHQHRRGCRRRADRDRPAPPLAGRQAHPGQQRPADPARRRCPVLAVKAD